MGDNKSETGKTNWFTGLKAEFNKIIWPTKKAVVKETAAVVIVSVVLGLIIAGLDFGIQNGVNALTNIGVEQETEPTIDLDMLKELSAGDLADGEVDVDAAADSTDDVVDAESSVEQ